MLNPMDLSERKILITGASSGIGRETAILLSKLGAKIILSGRNIDKLNETLSLLSGDAHVIKPFDLTLVDQIWEWLKKISEDIGPLNGLVHSAGMQIMKPLRVLREKDIEELLKVNLSSSVALISAFRQKDVCSENSSIVLMSSVMGLVGQPAISIYAASKAGVIGLTKSAALELTKQKIRVNCVAPGHVWTRMAGEVKDLISDEQYQKIEAMHPLGIGYPIDVALSVAFLLSDASRWITGTVLVVDGGYTAQ